MEERIATAEKEASQRIVSHPRHVTHTHTHHVICPKPDTTPIHENIFSEIGARFDLPGRLQDRDALATEILEFSARYLSVFDS